MAVAAADAAATAAAGARQSFDRFTNETFVKSKIQVATQHSMAPHSQLASQ